MNSAPLLHIFINFTGLTVSPFLPLGPCSPGGPVAPWKTVKSYQSITAQVWMFTALTTMHIIHACTCLIWNHNKWCSNYLTILHISYHVMWPDWQTAVTAHLWSSVSRGSRQSRAARDTWPSGGTSWSFLTLLTTLTLHDREKEKYKLKLLMGSHHRKPVKMGNFNNT